MRTKLWGRDECQRFFQGGHSTGLWETCFLHQRSPEGGEKTAAPWRWLLWDLGHQQSLLSVPMEGAVSTWKALSFQKSQSARGPHSALSSRLGTWSVPRGLWGGLCGISSHRCADDMGKDR